MAVALEKTIVIGGGITGLAAAFQLKQDGRDFALLEASGRLGGNIATEPVEGSGLSFDVDCAADGFLAREPEMAELCRELGLGDDLVVPKTSKAYVWFDGKLRRIPKSVLGVPIDEDSLRGAGILSDEGFREWLERGSREMPPVDDDTSVGEVVRERAGAEVFDRLVDPLLGGINAGNANELSLFAGAATLAKAARTGGAFVETLRARQAQSAKGSVFQSVTGGLGRVIEALASKLGDQVFLNTRAQSLHRINNGRWQVQTTNNGRWQVRDTFEGDRIIITTPAFAAAPLLQPHCASASHLLRKVEYCDVVVVTFVVQANEITNSLDGAGFLVPRSEGLLMTACSWTSSKWGHYNDQTHAILRVSAGRSDDKRVSQMTDTAIVETLSQELSATIGLRPNTPATIGLRANTLATRVTRWNHSLPQYHPGHLSRCDEIDASLNRDAPGVSVVGAAMRELGLPACVRQGRKSAVDSWRKSAHGS